MKPFNLESALAGEKVIARDGREVTQLVNFMVMTDQSLYGVIDKELCTWFIDGARCETGVNASNYQLFMAPKKLNGFVNIYDNGTSSYHSTMHQAKNLLHDGDVVACVDLSRFDEGHGL